MKQISLMGARMEINNSAQYEKVNPDEIIARLRRIIEILKIKLGVLQNEKELQTSYTP